VPNDDDGDEDDDDTEANGEAKTGFLCVFCFVLQRINTSN
jgi:hypothetical protein